MVFVSSFVDRPVVIPRGAIGSIQLADRAVTRLKVALSAVGSGEMGTYSLAKSVGTVSNIDVGTIVASYGSHGTIAARAARFGYGSNTGTMRAPLYRGRHGSFTGTVNSPFMRGRYGSWSGSIQAPRITGQIGSFNRLAGTLGATRITHGTLGASRQGPLQSIPGTLTIDTKAQGTLALQRLPRQVTDRGTISGQVGSFARGRVDGTMTVRYGSFQRLAGTLGASRTTHGTFAAARHQLLQNIPGSLGLATKTSGSLPIDSRAVGTLSLARLPRQVTDRGTIAGQVGSFARGRVDGTMTVRYGSFQRLAGTLGAARIAHGTFVRARLFQYIGSKLGSLGIAATRAGSITWAVPFPNTSYMVILTAEPRTSSDQGFITSIRTKKAASCVWSVTNNVAGAIPFGTLHIMAIPTV